MADTKRDDPFGESPVVAALGGLGAPAAPITQPEPVKEPSSPKPEPKVLEKPKRDGSSARSRSKPKPKVVEAKKMQLSCRIDPEVREMARRAVAFTPRLSLADFLESAIAAEYDRMVKARGDDFPELDGDLPKGRPIR